VALVLGTSALLVCACSSSGSTTPTSAASGHEVDVTARDNNTTVTLPLGASLVLSLDANPTTGFTWTVGQRGTLQQASRTYVPGNTSLVGSGGTQRFTFAPTAAGTQTLTLTYSQPFDTTTPPAKTFTLTVVVPGH
jgi:inhibitor of cysteine peptidase